MIKPNLNFHNEIDFLIDVSNRERALHLLKKISDSKPGLLQEAKFKLSDKTNGDVDIEFKNISVFDYQTKRIIFSYLNSIRKFY
jgi:hypothetical protein